MQRVAELKRISFLDDLPQLEPIIRHEPTEHGWRGLTAGGEVLDIRGRNGDKVEIPDGDLLVMHDGKPIGRRALRNDCPVPIAEYLQRFDRANDLFRSNHLVEALAEIDALVLQAPTTRALNNSAMILLAAGRWDEGFAQINWERPLARAALERGITPWHGEDIAGKRLLLLHDHGFGDSLMMLRYVPYLQARRADVIMLLPPELQRLAAQIGTVTANSIRVIEADYFCSMLMLAHALQVTPKTVLPNVPLVVDKKLREQWRRRIGKTDKPRIGIAWSVGQVHPTDYPREIPLAQLVEALAPRGHLYSVQKQDAAAAQALGVATYELEDFADCAAMMLQMDMIVAVDTAALHLAGTIGHPRMFGLLSHWHSWRWLAPWYPADRVKLCCQSAPGDWASALAQLRSHPCDQAKPGNS
jgi:hypothetical protein